jgi:hypothetical protein
MRIFEDLQKEIKIKVGRLCYYMVFSVMIALIIISLYYYFFPSIFNIFLFLDWIFLNLNALIILSHYFPFTQQENLNKKEENIEVWDVKSNYKK